ncbi:uncharacterized protein LOC122748172 [Dromiciops gliroides]|uniref:uncharacterized protein LOC122748172 n=1 Tax=Dromiciops gliroides TaxID=33562 RepID=UPI001CC41974|nr:uncharacterized protein LOC122748172 [Dromiciops gliroides]
MGPPNWIPTGLAPAGLVRVQGPSAGAPVLRGRPTPRRFELRFSACPLLACSLPASAPSNIGWPRKPFRLPRNLTGIAGEALVRRGGGGTRKGLDGCGDLQTSEKSGTQWEGVVVESSWLLPVLRDLSTEPSPDSRCPGANSPQHLCLLAGAGAKAGGRGLTSLPSASLIPSPTTIPRLCGFSAGATQRSFLGQERLISQGNHGRGIADTGALPSRLHRLYTPPPPKNHPQSPKPLTHRNQYLLHPRCPVCCARSCNYPFFRNLRSFNHADPNRCQTKAPTPGHGTSSPKPGPAQDGPGNNFQTLRSEEIQKLGRAEEITEPTP